MADQLRHRLATVAQSVTISNKDASTLGHLMRNEINEQGYLFRDWAQRGRMVDTSVIKMIRAFDPTMVLTIARGTSDRAADYGKYLLEILLGIPVGSTSPSTVTLFQARPKATGVLALAISQSGESPDIIAESKALQAGGALVVAVTNSPHSPLAKCADTVVDISAGPEYAVAATKSFTLECAALADLAFALAEVDLDRKTIADAVDEALGSPLVTDAAQLLHIAVNHAKFLVCIGRGPGTPIAAEGALKIMETAALPALAYSAADFAHGPRALISTGAPVLIVQPAGPAHESMTELIEAITDAHAPLIVLGPSKRADLEIPTQLTDPLTAPIEQAVLLQRVALELALLRGHDPDHPPALTKVTLTT